MKYNETAGIINDEMDIMMDFFFVKSELVRSNAG